MKENIGIQQEQRLAQRLSPRQVLHARVLEMTPPELEEEFNRQLDDNPALEAQYADVEEPQDDNVEQTMELDVEDDPADYINIDNYRSGAEDWDFLNQKSIQMPDLYESLRSQAALLDIPQYIAEKVKFLIGNLDENGYLLRTIHSLSEDYAINTGCEVNEGEMRKAFEIVRGLDPAGVGAVDLRDCLMLQLSRKRQDSTHMEMAYEVVKDYFDLLSKKHYQKLASALGVNKSEELVDVIDVIRSLNPKPGSAVEMSPSTIRMGHITPDVALEEDDGRFTVSIVSRLPQLQIARSFATETSNETSTNRGMREAQAFIKSKRDEAEAFISALKNRSESLLAVTEAIVGRQLEFFKTGDRSKLRPMVLKDISADTGLDLSAISRTTAGKYVVAPTGLYPLKMFFNEAPNVDNDTSSHLIMSIIQEIIDGESPNKPLSDQAILEEMERRGHTMARRTITKYREKLGIPVARLRKKL